MAIETVSGFLLARGNTKLGKRIYTFSLPAIDTCPGRSKICSAECYALKGRMGMPWCSDNFQKRLTASRLKNFSERMEWELKSRYVKTLRLHVSGDFYSARYAKKWLEIAKACPATKIFVYSRSWRIPRIRKVLVELSRLRNVRMWYSTDCETGIPSRIPARVRVAYMSIDDDDVPQGRADLMFRVNRRTVVKRMGGVLVCPKENGTHAKTDCGKCQICIAPLEVLDARRLALPVV